MTESQITNVGLVLSGGGVKGLAHIGVIKALEEENIFPKVVSGTSAGSIVGALYCAGYNSSEIFDWINKPRFLNPQKLSFRKPGILNIEKYRDVFLEALPHDSFEKLERKLYVCSSNMETGQHQIHEAGSLIDKLLASSSVPGMFSPVNIDGQLHMDGGITCNFPTEPLIDASFPLIGSYVCYPKQKTKNQLSNSVKILVRSSQLMLWKQDEPKFKQLNFVFCPEELSDVAFYDTRKMKEACDIGYEYAKGKMKELLSTIS